MMESRDFQGLTNISYAPLSAVASSFSGLTPKTCETSNAIIIKNLSTEFEKFLNILSLFGEIFKVKFNANKGIVFVIFYDSRHSEKAQSSLDGFVFESMRLKCEFVHKSQEYDFDQLSLDKCPSLYVSCLDKKQSQVLAHFSVSKLARNFGEVKNIFKFDNETFIIEFFDFRSAKKMLSSKCDLFIDSVPIVCNYSPAINQERIRFQNLDDNVKMIYNMFRYPNCCTNVSLPLSKLNKII